MNDVTLTPAAALAERVIEAARAAGHLGGLAPQLQIDLFRLDSAKQLAIAIVAAVHVGGRHGRWCRLHACASL